MSDDLRERLLGSGVPDPGCETCFELLDQYADMVVRGVDTTELFPQIVAHLRSCPACREDTEGLIAALRNERPPDEPR